MTHVAILGAGIAGLSAGWLLNQNGVDFTILEKQSYPGGLARSFRWHDFNCDFAAHRLFTSDEAILQQLLNLVPMGRHIRRSRIHMHGKWMRDPLDILELATNLRLSDRLGMISSYLIRPRRLPETNFENYVLSRYGSSLYRLFFKPYTEKLFGIPGDEISVLWARQKVRLANPLDNLRENTKNKFQYFYYPVRGGYGAIANSLYEKIKPNVALNSRVTELEVEGDRIRSVKYQQNDQEFRLNADYLISTLPLNITSRMLGSQVNLQFQKVDAVYLLVDQPFVSDNHWIYFIDQNISMNRMVEFKNMSSTDAPEGRTVLCAEVTQQHDHVIDRVIQDLDRISLVDKEKILDATSIREPFAYPVYNRDYELSLQAAQDNLSKVSNLFLVGRNAEFRHREVDDNFSAASDVVTEILRTIRPPAAQIEAAAPMISKPAHPSVYVVILTFNHIEVTLECLESINNIHYDNLHIVVVDNGSQDGTPTIIRDHYPEYTIIENRQNLGVPAGFNVGFKWALESGADFIFMLNNDTVLAPNVLDLLLAQAETDPLAGIIMPKVLYYGSQSEVWSHGGRYRRFPPAILFDDRRHEAADVPIRLIEYAPSCGLLIHRQSFERAGLFDPGYFFNFDDWDFSERVRAHGLHIWYVAEAIIWHKVSKTTQGPASPMFWYTHGASMARFYKRHGRPAWLSLPVHAGYYIFREFFIKQNWRYFKDYWRGLRDGIQKPLGALPRIG